MTDPISLARTALQRIRGDSEACETALADWARRNAWPARRGDPIPPAPTAGGASDPTGQQAVWLAQEAQRDLDDIHEAHRLLAGVLERRRQRHATARPRLCGNCRWRPATRRGRCAACAEYWRVHGHERPARLIERDRDRTVYPHV